VTSYERINKPSIVTRQIKNVKMIIPDYNWGFQSLAAKVWRSCCYESSRKTIGVQVLCATTNRSKRAAQTQSGVWTVCFNTGYLRCMHETNLCSLPPSLWDDLSPRFFHVTRNVFFPLRDLILPFHPDDLSSRDGRSTPGVVSKSSSSVRLSSSSIVLLSSSVSWSKSSSSTVTYCSGALSLAMELTPRVALF